MPHVHTHPGEKDPTVSAYIIDISQAEPRLWLHRHKKLGVWLQFGGHVDPPNTPWTAMCEEVEQEVGFAVDQLQVLQPHVRLHHLSGAVLHPVPAVSMTHPFPAMDHFHSDDSYVFVTDQPPRNNVAEGESVDMRQFTKAELLAIPAKDIPESCRQISLFALDQILGYWESVPATDFER